MYIEQYLDKSPDLWYYEINDLTLKSCIAVKDPVSE